MNWFANKEVPEEKLLSMTLFPLKGLVVFKV